MNDGFLYFYAAEVVRVYDGDSIRFDIDLGFDVWQMNQPVRLAEINAPELRGEERERGLEVRDYVRELLPVGTKVILKTDHDKTGKYGRWIAWVFLTEQTTVSGKNLNEHLVLEGMAVKKEY